MLARAPRRITLALPLGRRLKIPADSALKIFAFIYSVGESESEIPVLFSAVFISSQKRTLKNGFLYVFRPQTNSVCYKSAIGGKMLKKSSKTLAKYLLVIQEVCCFLGIFIDLLEQFQNPDTEKITINLLIEIRPLLEIRVQ